MAERMVFGVWRTAAWGEIWEGAAEESSCNFQQKMAATDRQLLKVAAWGDQLEVAVAVGKKLGFIAAGKSCWDEAAIVDQWVSCCSC